MAEARQKRVETKIKQEVQRYKRALNWHHTQQQQIHYLGNSAGFKTDEQTSDTARLQIHQLPIAHNATALCSLWVSV